MHAILSSLFQENIYKDFVPMAESLTGWGGRAHLFGNLVRVIQPKTIIEVGSWKGQSAITMAEACKNIGLDCTIICVDTWLGSTEHILKHGQELRRINGYPTVYYQFLSNVVHRKVEKWIIPFPATSITAAEILGKLSIKADLIYIDASHQYDDVLSDIRKYFALLNKDGVLFGHDYSWEPVQRAVNSFCRQKRIETEVEGKFWMLRTDRIKRLGCRIR